MSRCEELSVSCRVDGLVMVYYGLMGFGWIGWMDIGWGCDKT